MQEASEKEEQSCERFHALRLTMPRASVDEKSLAKISDPASAPALPTQPGSAVGECHGHDAREQQQGAAWFWYWLHRAKVAGKTERIGLNQPRLRGTHSHDGESATSEPVEDRAERHRIN